MEQPPGEDARRIVDEQVAGDEEQEPGNDGPVQGRPTRYCAPFLPGGMTREPQEQTMLRVGQKMRSSRPHAAQPMYVPAGRAGEAGRGVSAPDDDFMGSPACGRRRKRSRAEAYAAAIGEVKPGKLPR